MTRKRVPLLWADIQFDLGVALTRLGLRAALATLGGQDGGQEKNTALLKQAVDAFKEALKEQTRERDGRSTGP